VHKLVYKSDLIIEMHGATIKVMHKEKFHIFCSSKIGILAIIWNVIGWINEAQSHVKRPIDTRSRRMKENVKISVKVSSLFA
jgi:hypothetical protein